jgi:hypothetical protein
VRRRLHESTAKLLDRSASYTLIKGNYRIHFGVHMYCRVYRRSKQHKPRQIWVRPEMVMRKCHFWALRKKVVINGSNQVGCGDMKVRMKSSENDLDPLND